MSPPPVGQNDLSFLHSELHPVSDKWYSLGVQLKIPIGTLKCIRSDNHTVAECLLEMLTVWLKCTNPSPTWNILINALESPPMGEGLLGKQLSDKYCTRQEEAVINNYHTEGLTSSPTALTIPQGISL